MTSSVFSILLVSLVFCVSVVDPNSIKIRITNQALDTLRNQAQAIIQEPLPNQPSDILQKLVCFINRLTITELTVHQANLRFRQNSDSQFDIQNFEARFSFIYHTETKDFVAQGVSANIELSLIQTQEGRLSVTMPTCKVSVEEMRLTDNPWILEKIGMECLRRLLNFWFCPVVQVFIYIGNWMLEPAPMMPEAFPDFDVSISCSLTNDAHVTVISLDMSFSGLLFAEGENIPAVDPAVEPVFTQDNLMAYVGVSEFVFNSAAVAFYNAGVLGKKFETITSKPVKGVLRLIQLFTQPLRMKAPLAAAVKVTEPPRIRITQQQGVTVNLKVQVSAESVPEKKEPKGIITVSVTCEFSVKATFQRSAERNQIQLPFSNFRCNSATGDQAEKKLARPLKELPSFLKTKISQVVEELVNDKTELPPLLHGLVFTDPLLEYQDGFVVVGGNLNRTPAKK